MFFGTSDFAVPSLHAVHAHTELQAVVTQPDRPGGRGQKLRPTPVKAAALALGVPVLEPQRLRDFARERSGEHYDLFVLASYGRILPHAVLDIPNLGSFNVHPSLLPKYRGATPIQTALRNGDSETGVTIMLMDAGMDTGDVVLQERTPIAPEENYGALHDRLALFGAQALTHAIDLARSGHVPHYAQHGQASTTKPIAKDDLAIDWSMPAKQIANIIRAFSPAPAARANLNGESVKLLRAREVPSPAASVAAGEIAGVNGDGLVVRCGEGAIEVLELVPANRNPMTGAAFAR